MNLDDRSKPHSSNSPRSFKPQRQMEIIGQLLDGRYRIVQILSSGAFSQTYLAADTRRPGHPQCVVKQLRPPSNNSKILKTALRLFRQEAEILEKLGRNDRIPLLLAYFEDNNHFYLVEEFIEGHPLHKELIPGHPWKEDLVIELLEEILNILVFVHQNGVIHRDVNPSNLIRRKSDQALVLIDFGSVKAVSSQLAEENNQPMRTIATGTPSYMPIEQFQGNPQFNSDLYAVGMIAIQALTGLEGSDLPKLQDPSLSISGEIAWRQRARVSNELASIIDKMVHHYYGKRYKSAIDAIAELNQLTGKTGLVNPTSPNHPPYKTHKPRRDISLNRLWTVVGIAATGLVGLIVIFGLFQVLSRPDPVKSEAALKRGVERLEAGDPEAAIKAFTRSIQLFPDNSEAFRKRANAYYDLQKYEQAIADYTQAIKLDPTNPDIYFNRSLAYHQMRDFGNAINDLNQVIRLNPEDTDAFYQRGLAHYSQENYEAAILDYTEVIRRQPNNSEAYRARGSAHVKSGNLQAGMADYTEAIRLNPESAAAYYNRGRARFHLGDYQGALADYNQVISWEPDNAEAYGNRCSTYINLGNYEAAIESCSRSIQLNPTAMDYNNRCIAHLNVQNYDAAIGDCTKAIELEPNNSKAHSNRGLVHSLAEDYEAAIADYSQAISLNPNDAESYSNRAQAHAELGNYSEAIADYAQAIRIRPNLAGAFYGRGMVRASLGDRRGAISDFEQAGKLFLEQGLTGGFRDSQYQIQRLQ